MKSSTELKILILQLYEKKISGGHFDFARQIYSQQQGTLVIGSQPGDWYEGYESIIRFYEREGASDVQLMVEEIQAFEEDILGWVVDLVIAKLPVGHDVPVRHTYIFHREEKEWKVVHAHISVGIPDESLRLLPIDPDTIS